MEKRQIKLSSKQLIPPDLDEYLEEHSVGDVVSGRLIEQTGENAIVELIEGAFAPTCAVKAKIEPIESNQKTNKPGCFQR